MTYSPEILVKFTFHVRSEESAIFSKLDICFFILYSFENSKDFSWNYFVLISRYIAIC